MLRSASPYSRSATSSPGLPAGAGPEGSRYSREGKPAAVEAEGGPEAEGPEAEGG